MRVSCSAPKATASEGLIPSLEMLGITPIVTNLCIRAVYEGDDCAIGEAIVARFELESEHEMLVLYSAKDKPERHGGATSANPKQPKCRHKKTRNRSRR